MFKFLKDKLKQAVSVFSKKAEEEAKVEEPIEEAQQEEAAEEQVAVEEKRPEPKEEKVEEQAETAEQETEEKEEPAPAEEQTPTVEPKEEKAETVEEKPQEEAPAKEETPKAEPEKAEAAKEHVPAQEEAKKAGTGPARTKGAVPTPSPPPERKETPKPHPGKEAARAVPAEEEEAPKPAQARPAVQAEEEPAKKSFFRRFAERITKVEITEQKFEELFWELEMGLMESNIAIEVIEKIKADLKKELVNRQVAGKELSPLIERTLQASLSEILTFPERDLIAEIRAHKGPYIILLVGINGTGKTTTIGKLIRLLQDNGQSTVVAAADTFRAAAIDQLEAHTRNLNVKLIKHNYGADPAAVAFDAIRYAEAKAIDAVLIDSAGRMHSNANLMQELSKIDRVAKPDLTIFIGDALTGNDCVEQARLFDEAVGIDGTILAKADADEKGGAAISLAYVTRKPVFFLGTGQRYEDLEPFRKERILSTLGFSSS